MNQPGDIGDETLQPEVLLRIEAICDRFETAWKAGQRPQIEEELAALPGSGRLKLLRGLLVLDVDYRRKRGESPTQDEYTRRFPHHAELIQEVFAPTFGFGEGLGGEADTTVSQSSNEKEPVKKSASAQPVSPYLPPGYENLGELGRGGMGIVYKVRHLKSNRIVALKMIRSGGHASREEMNRFRTEAQVIAGLNHPHIVQIYDVGEHNGNPFFSLEYCANGSLANKLRGDPISARAAATLVEQLARAMAASHANGILHRDLKPGNILLAEADTPKITDFGLAKQLDAVVSLTEGGDTPRTQQTVTGAILGTPCYMSPEQAEGRTNQSGQPTDIYALGAILYECLTGRPPFKGATVMETLDQVRTQEPVSPRLLQPATPRDLETICLKCLRKEPEKRYASADGMAEDLRRFLDHKPIVARPVGRMERAVKWVRRNPIETVLASVILALLLGSSALVYAKYLDAKEQERLAKKNEDAAENARKAEVERGQERDAALEQANAAIAKEAERVKERDYQLGISDFLLAKAAYDNGDVLSARHRLDQIPPQQRKFEWHYLARQIQGGLFTLYGHASSVQSASFSPDGTRILTGSRDGTAKVWDARTGTLLIDLKGHDGPVRSASFSPDGTRVVTGSDDKTAKVWDTKTGTSLIDLKGHTGWVVSVSFSPDGRCVVTGGYDETAKVWDTKTGTLLIDLKGHTGWVTSVSFSPDGTRVLAGSFDGTAKVWDVRTGILLIDLKGHDAPVWSASFSTDGTRVVTGSRDGTAKVWDAKTGMSLIDLKGHTKSVWSASFSPDGRCVVTGSEDGTTKVWDTKTGTSLIDLKGHTKSVWSDSFSSVWSASFSPDGMRVVTGSEDGTAKVWDAKTGTSLIDLKGHTKSVTSVSFSLDGTRVVTSGSEDGTAKVWDAKTGTLLIDLKGHTGWVTSASFSPDGTRVVTSSEDGIAKVWDTKTGTSLFDLKGHTKSVWSASFSPDGTRVVTGGSLGITKVWDAKTGVPLLELKGHANFVQSASFSPDGTRILTGSLDGTAKVWDAKTGVSLLDLKGHTRQVWSASFSPDGMRVVTGSADGIAKVWDATTGVPLLELKGHANSVQSVSFSPDGTRILTGSYDGTAKVWDAKTGVPLLDLKGHTHRVWSAAFSPDGMRVVTGGSLGTAKVWDATTGTTLIDLKGHTGAVTSVSFSPDGMRVVTGSNDNSAKVWDSKTGTTLLDLKGHTKSVWSASFSPDGTRVVSGSLDCTAKVWDSKTGRLLIDLKGHMKSIWIASFSPDGTHVVTGSYDGTAKVWEVRTGLSITLNGHDRPVQSASFSADGTRVVTGSYDGPVKVWDATTGERKYETIPPTLSPSAYSPDGHFFAHKEGDRVRLVALELTEEERSERLRNTRAQPAHHLENYRTALANKDEFAAVHQLDCAMAFDPVSRQNNLRARCLDFPTRLDLIARTCLHSPLLVPKGVDLLRAHFTETLNKPTAINFRTLGGLLIRDGKATEAIQPIMISLSLRNSDLAPPVEELLLALAYHELKQPDEATQWLAKAQAWIDKEGTPTATMALIGKLATGNPFHALAPNMADPLDPRYQWPQWESWLEMEVFLNEARSKILAK